MSAGEKGFVISFDAMIALLLMLVMLITITAYLGNVKFEANSSVALREIAMDSLTVLDKSGKLENAVSTGRVNELRAFINKMHHSICTDLRIYSESDLNNAAMTVLRENCKKSFDDLATVKRSIVAQNGSDADFYLAELRAWYRVRE